MRKTLERKEKILLDDQKTAMTSLIFALLSVLALGTASSLSNTSYLPPDCGLFKECCSCQRDECCITTGQGPEFIPYCQPLAGLGESCLGPVNALRSQCDCRAGLYCTQDQTCAQDQNILGRAEP
ncbi:uncharacterized protein LOC106012720 [Aplysia californica]|uniref:Uncharacterized protein LOC106012720 n=1 Tax=Aplysia californica TaxID=6500 RepID=A0ABM1A6T7_APLCA|nr:uncharacterized protein LOC106012720 [Aplysia californica]